MNIIKPGNINNKSNSIPLATQRRIRTGIKNLTHSLLHPKEKLKHISTLVFEAVYNLINLISMNLKNKPRSSGGDLVNFAFKKKLFTDPITEKQLHKAFDGSNSSVTLKQRKLFAESYQKNEILNSDDPEGIKRIVEHRRIVSEIQSKRKERSSKALLKRIHDLTNPASNRVVHLKDGGASFSISGGWLSHSVTYEIKMIPDAHRQPRYYFVIHNRGEGLNHKMHGKVCFLDSQGVEYRKTSLEIEVPLQALSESFLKKLISSNKALNRHAAYNCIQQYLLDKGGVVQQSHAEKKWVQLHHQLAFNQSEGLRKRLRMEMKACEKKLIHEDPSFHSIQMFGTCTESNATGPEKKMASLRARDQLKLYTIQKMTEDVNKRILMYGSFKRKLLNFSEMKQEHLRKKLGF